MSMFLSELSKVYIVYTLNFVKMFFNLLNKSTNIMNKQLQFFILLALIGLSNFQLNAQTNGTYTNNNGTGDGLWSTPTNWTGGIIADATGIATLEADVDVNSDQSVGAIIITDAITISSASNSTLTFTTGNGNYIIENNAASGNVTIDCNITLATSGRFKNVSGASTIFTNGNTISSSTFGLTIENESSNPFEFHGEITGSGLFNIINAAGADGGVTFEATSDLSTFTGGFKTRNNPIIFNSTNVITDSNTIELEGSSTLTFNVADSFEGNIYKDSQVNNTSVVTFNKNQSNLGYLRVLTRPLSLVFAPEVTLVQFSSYTTSATEGVVDLQNYYSGVLRIGTTATEVSQTILDSWLLDGVEPTDDTIVQDASGYIRVPKIASTTADPIDWEDGSSWIGGIVPTATDNVIIQGNLQINTDVTVNDFTIIEVGAIERVKVEAGHSLTINGNAITKNNLFAYSTSSTFGSLIFNGTVNGDIRYYRYVNGNPNGNDLIASPVDQNFSTLANNNDAELVSNPSNPDQKLFGPFDNTNGEFLNWNKTGSDVIVPGEGYRAGTVSGSTMYFKGTVPNSPVANVSVTISNGGDTTYGLWNLIGNPFPSYLDFGEFWTENSGALNGGGGAYQAIYGYDANDADGSNYTIWNNINSSDKITPSQGFFVRTISGGTVTFTPAMRTLGTSDDFIVGRSSTPNLLLSELFLSNASSTQTTKIYFAEHQTRGLDPGYDAAAFTGSTNGIYTHLVEHNEGLEFAIQALPYNDFNDVVVPLGVKGDAGTQLTIGLNVETASIPSHINVYLEDNITNTWTLLNTGDYVFTPSDNLNGTGRFYIHYSSPALSIKDNLLNGLNIYSEQATKTVVIKGQLNTNTTAVVYDMHGRIVLQQALDTSNTTNIVEVNALRTGVYIVELKSETQNRTQKIIIN